MEHFGNKIIYLKIITSVSEIEKLKDRWNELFLSCPETTPFQSWEWNFNKAKFLIPSHKLLIITAYNNNDKLVGIAPLKLRNYYFFPFKILEFLGNTSDYLDFIVEANYKDVFFNELFIWIKNDSGISFIILNNIREETKSILQDFLPFEFFTRSVCPFIALPKQKALLNKAISKRVNRNIKTNLNKLLPNERLEYYVPKTLKEVYEYADSFIELHKKRQNTKGRKSNFLNKKVIERFRHLLSLLYNANMLKIGILKIDFVPASIHINLILNKKEYSYMKAINDDYAKFSPGTLLEFFMINEAIEKEFEIYDFLLGDEEYKYFWTDKKNELFRAFYSKTKIGSFFWKFEQSSRMLLSKSKIIKKIMMRN